VVAVATARASLWVLPPRRGGVRSALTLAALLPLVFWEATRSGVDVARRALHPALPLDPALLHLATGHGSTHPITLATAVVMNLMPGTLTVEFAGRGLRLHVIDRRHDHLELLTRMERRLTWALGEGDGKA
jgi:multicomponent Na+:H+ antiporter subunit E